MKPNVLVDGDASPHEVWFLHGILGSGLNWRSFARELRRRVPGWTTVLVDLRGHGDSGPGEPPHTVDACVGDLKELARERGVPTVLVGHSFGGKVALAASARLGPALRSTWVLDAVPGPVDLSAPRTDPDDVLRVVDACATLPMPVASRDEVRRELLALGFSEGVAGWMTTNLRRTDAGLVWRFNLGVVRALLADYARVDLWPAVGAGPGTVHLVRAGRSDRWGPDDLGRLADVAARPRVDVRVLEEAGHWVHVDAPERLLGWFAADLERLGADPAGRADDGDFAESAFRSRRERV